MGRDFRLQSIVRPACVAFFVLLKFATCDFAMTKQSILQTPYIHSLERNHDALQEPSQLSTPGSETI
jgi:hypothetical protein